MDRRCYTVAWTFILCVTFSTICLRHVKLLKVNKGIRRGNVSSPHFCSSSEHKSYKDFVIFRLDMPGCLKKDVKTGSNKEMCDIHHNRLFSFVLCNRTSRVLTLTVGVTSHTHPTHTHRYTTPPPVCGHWPDLPGWQAWPCI